MQSSTKKNVHVTALSEYLCQKYGVSKTSRLLAHIILFKKALKYSEFKLMDLDMFCFQLYFVVDYLVEDYIPKWATVDVSKMKAIHVLIAASYFVYSYSGPETQYYINMFVAGQLHSKFPWIDIHIDILRTDLSTRMLNLYRNFEYWHGEHQKFLSFNKFRKGLKTNNNSSSNNNKRKTGRTQKICTYMLNLMK